MRSKTEMIRITIERDEAHELRRQIAALSKRAKMTIAIDPEYNELYELDRLLAGNFEHGQEGVTWVSKHG